MSYSFFRERLYRKHFSTILCLFAAGLCFPEIVSGTYAVITIDVCWTCGDDFRGTWNGKDYGIPLITEKLDSYGFKGTFFISPYCPDNLKNRMFHELRFLLSRGHDIQLHTHPDIFDPARRDLSMYSKDEKRKILSVGIKNLQEAGAPRPIAHRAGQLCIDPETLDILPEFGISIDSSICTHFADCGAHIPKDSINRFVKIGGVYELPIFSIEAVPYIGNSGTVPLQIDSTTWWQQKRTLEQVAEKKYPLVTIFLHFFSLYDREVPAHRFEPFNVLGPNESNIQALDNILALLKRDSRFEVITVKELWDIHNQDPGRLDGPSFIPSPGLLPTYVRSWKHLFKGGIINFFVVLAPLIPIGAICLAVALIWKKRIKISDKNRK